MAVETGPPEGASAAELDQLRRRVLNVVGHELRTPATTIRGLAESLAKADDRSARETIVPSIVRNARRLEGLLDDLLVAAQIETALPVGAPEKVDVGALAWAEWGGGEDLEIDAEQPGPLAAIMRESLRRVLRHVFDNARRYGRPPTALHLRSDDRTVTLLISSPGEDLHPEELRLAVEPFFRGERAVMETPGIGLGLAVSRALVEQAGGTLRLERREGGGTATRIELPKAAG